MTSRAGPTRHGRRAAVAVLAVVLVLLAASATLAASAWKARAWFDAPLPGAVLPLAPYPVVVHAADDSGVARVRFLVDGVPTTTLSVSQPSDLITLTWTWEPVALGPHMLTAVAEGTDGSLSDPVSVGVTVSADADAQPTPDISPSPSPVTGSATPRPSGATPGPTPTPRSTVAPTPIPTAVPTPCPILSPNLTSPYVYETVYVNPPTLVWTPSENGCAPAAYHVLIAEDGEFTAILVDELVAGDTTFWDPPSPLPETPTCQYFWLVRAVDGDGNEIQEVETSAFTIQTGRTGGC